MSHCESFEHEKIADRLSIDEIRQDPSVWPRANYDPAALERYRGCLDRLPPVHVDRNTHTLLDGFHRVKVFEQAGQEKVPVIFEDCPPEKHLAWALHLNLHGAPIPISQRNQVILKLAAQGLTQEEISKAAGLSQASLSRILASNIRDSSDKGSLFEAIRLVEAGHSFREAEQMSGVPKSTLERAVVEAKMRQELIRKHLQARSSLTTLLRYPDRGPWGKASYFGNCTGYLVVDLIDYFKPVSVFDPMEGSGTTREVCFDFEIDYEGRDLHSGFDLLSSPLPNRQFDLIFWHPPYWPGHRYSQHPNDFSNADGVEDYLQRLQEGFQRLQGILAPEGHLVVLIGDGRKNGTFYPVHSEMIQWDLLPLEAILIKEGDHERRARHFRYGPAPFIPTLHEYVLIFKGASQ